MTRNDFIALARVRLRDARVLVRAGRYEAAYYLSGYVVEFALKACIANRTKRHDFPDKDQVIKSWSHDLKKLCEHAGLKTVLDEAIEVDPTLGDHWACACKWGARSRYEPPAPIDKEADSLLIAIADPKHGVLRWLARHWKSRTRPPARP